MGSAGTKISQQQCIFCGGLGKNSREHIFSKWIQGAIPNDGQSRHFVRVGPWRPGELAPPATKGTLHRPGRHLAQTLRVACKPCNNGWMSDIVKAAEPQLRDLILGNWPRLREAEVTALATWATLTTMVAENAQQAPARTTSQAERDYIQRRGIPPPNWRVWIGPYEDVQPTFKFRRPLGHVVSPGGPAAADTQITIFGLRRVVFQVVSSTHPAIHLDKMDLSHEALRPIWPMPMWTRRGPARPSGPPFAFDQVGLQIERFTQSVIQSAV